MALGTAVGLGPEFSAHVCSGRAAGWLTMTLGTEVGISPGDTVLDGDPAPNGKGHNSLPRLSRTVAHLSNC